MKADELVLDAVSAPHHVSYVGQLSTIRWGTSGAAATVIQVEHRAPDLTRRLYLAPQSLYGDYIISRGTQSYEFDVAHNRIIRSVNPAADNQVAVNDNATLLAANYHAVPGPRESVAGHQAISISLVNKYTGVRTMRVWLDAQTKIVLAKESYHADGALASRTRFDDIRYTSSIPLGVFSTATPPGYSVVEGRHFAAPSSDLAQTLRQAGFQPVGPRYLPDGFAVISVALENVKNVRSLHLLYSDGLRDLSLFENNGDVAADFGSLRPTKTKVEQNDANYVKDGPTTLLTWREHGLAFALVGDLDVRELRQIAGSVIP